jgi:hypothetical protein
MSEGAMPVEFRCPQCGKLLRTGDDSVGRQARCPECGTVSVVPAQTVGGETPPQTPVAEGGNPFGPPPVSDTEGSGNPYLSPQSPLQAAAPPPSNGKAIAALVLSLVGMIAWCCPLVGFPITILGLIFGILALREQRSTMAIIAVVLSSVGILLTGLNAISGVIMTMARHVQH